MTVSDEFVETSAVMLKRMFSAANSFQHLEYRSLHLSAYIHSNPKELQKWGKNPEEYPWSTYQDYTDTNRWNKLLATDLILDAHSNVGDYQKFVQTSGAKLNEMHDYKSL